jgi:hypothetical protein
VNPYRRRELDEVSKRVFQTTYSFLRGRLSEARSVDWAVRLKDEDLAQRAAVLRLLDQRDRRLAEPWNTAWQLIEESWSTEAVEENTSVLAYHLKQRLRGGDRSGALIDQIVAAVAPVLKVRPFSDLHLHIHSRPTRIRTVRDLFSVRIASGRVIDSATLNLGSVSEISFLVALANALDSAVAKGLDIAHRLGWNGARHVWLLGQMHRAYFVPVGERALGDHEPDQFHSGIAPSVKLLHAVVERLAFLEPAAAIPYVDRWLPESRRSTFVFGRQWQETAGSCRPATSVAFCFLVTRTRYGTFTAIRKSQNCGPVALPTSKQRLKRAYLLNCDAGRLEAIGAIISRRSKLLGLGFTGALGNYCGLRPGDTDYLTMSALG